MNSLALSNLNIQIYSVQRRIEEFRQGGGDSSFSMADAPLAQSVLRSLRRTRECLAQGGDPRAEAFIAGFICTVSKVPDTEPILRRGDKALKVSGRYVAQVFADSGAQLRDYQNIILDPELAADVIDEAHARMMSDEEMLQRDLKSLRLARREAARAMDASMRSRSDADASPEAA